MTLYKIFIFKKQNREAILSLTPQSTLLNPIQCYLISNDCFFTSHFEMKQIYTLRLLVFRFVGIVFRNSHV